MSEGTITVAGYFYYVKQNGKIYPRRCIPEGIPSQPETLKAFNEAKAHDLIPLTADQMKMDFADLESYLVVTTPSIRDMFRKYNYDQRGDKGESTEEVGVRGPGPAPQGGSDAVMDRPVPDRAL